MNKKILLLIVPILVSLTTPLFAEELNVQLKSARLRSAPQHWAPGTATLSYGDSVTSISSDGAWVKVKTSSGKVGYLHDSALTEKKVVLRISGSGKGSADASDVVLAGKGFNKEVERQFASQNPAASFGAVNQMEKISVSESDILAFIKAGGLRANG